MTGRALFYIVTFFICFCVSGFFRIKRKSSIIRFIIPKSFTSPNEDLKVSTNIFDGASIENMQVLTNCNSYLQYASDVFIPYTCSQAVITKRIDVV